MVDELTLFVWNENATAVHAPLFLRMSAFKKDSQYPGGTYANAAFTLPRDILNHPSLLRAGYKVEVWDGGALIYAGFVESLEDVRRAGRQGTRVNLQGAWGWIMEKRGIERNWADNRLSTEAWDVDTSVSGAELASVDRKDRIRITPKAEAWTNGNFFRLTYQTPTGETVGKITNDYDMQEGGQAWDLELYNGLAAEWNVTTSGTGSQDVDLGTAVAQLHLYARANQTPSADGTYYGEVSDVKVFASRDHASATTGAEFNAYEMGLDIVDLLGVDTSLISSSVGSIDSSLTNEVIPFISNGHEAFGSQLARIAGFGDSSNNSIGFGLRTPFESADNLPELFLETYPDESGYEYETSVEESGIAVRLNVDDVWNYVTVEYTNRLGNTKTYTPGDDATLEDTDSQALYGLRRVKITLPLANDQIALKYGQRYLARHKEPTYAVTRPLKVTRLRAKNGGYVPASQIDAGQRLRIVDLPNEIGQAGIGGVTFLITQTQYDHDRRQVSLSIGGRPDNLALWLNSIVDEIPV